MTEHDGVERSTATETFRAMLNERGVEHGDLESSPYPPYNSTRRITTFWVNKWVWQYIEDEREGGDIELEGRYMSMSVTPEQAIAATLGVSDATRDQLKAENARLRNELDAVGIAAYLHGRDQLKAENAKLRELVKSMYYDLTHMTFPPDWVTDYEADMRELGVEVNE